MLQNKAHLGLASGIRVALSQAEEKPEAIRSAVRVCGEPHFGNVSAIGDLNGRRVAVWDAGENFQAHGYTAGIINRHERFMEAR